MIATSATGPYTRESILTEDELAAHMKISREKLRKADLPTVYFGRDRRFVLGQVLDVLEERAK